MHNEHYYVQKAVGWALREIYNIYPVKCLSYQHKNLAAISAITYSAATEKLTKNDEIKINLLRKKNAWTKDLVFLISWNG